jgi:hypothetical protein
MFELLKGFNTQAKGIFRNTTVVKSFIMTTLDFVNKNTFVSLPKQTQHNTFLEII